MNRAGLVLVVGALIAGGALGFVMGSTMGGGSDYGGPEEDIESPTHRPSRPDPSVADPGLTEDGTPRERNNLLSMLERIPISKAEKGNGTITGEVNTEAGQPVEGAVVRLRLYRQGGRGKRVKNRYKRAQGPPEDKSLDEYVRGQVESYAGSIANRLEARTNRDGEYTINGVLEDGTTYYAYAYSRGYECRANPHVRNLRAGMSVNFLAKPVYEIPAKVYLPDGSVAEDAQIQRWFGNNSSSSAYWFADDPVIQLEPGSFQLRATGGEEYDLRSDKISVEIPEEGPFEEIEFRLKHEPGVRGTVKFPDGETSMSAQVVLKKVEGAVPDEEEFLKQGGKRNWVYPHNAKYTFRDITAGTYLLGLVYNNSIVVAHTSVDVGESMAVKDLDLPAPDPSEYVLVTAEGPDGRPVTDCSIYTGYRATGSNSSGGGRTQKLPSGQYRVFHQPVKADQLKSDGTHYLTLTSRKFGTKTVEYPAASTQTLTVRFDEPAFLEVTISGYKGSGMEGKINLALQEVKDGKGSRHRSYWYGGRTGLDAEGRQKFGPKAPGEYDLTINVKTKGSRQVPGDTVRIHLKAGKNTEIVNIPKLYSLTVVTDADTNTSFRLQLRDQSRGYWSSNSQRAKEGRVVFDNLGSGEYTLQAWGGQSGKMTISIPARTSVRFEATVYNAQMARVKNENGSLVKAGVREGDLLVAIDGTEFTTNRQMRALMTLASEKKGATLTILRGGRRMTITATFGNLWSSSETGVSWEQASR